eukprot:9492188-Pyramimonas_sp.AAC.1
MGRTWLAKQGNKHNAILQHGGTLHAWAPQSTARLGVHSYVGSVCLDHLSIRVGGLASKWCPIR